MERNLSGHAGTLDAGLDLDDRDRAEPASWALMIAGFGSLGVVLRRRRALAGAATA